MGRVLYLFFAMLVFTTCKVSDQPTTAIIAPTYGTISEAAMVVSARQEASAIGVEILKRGGNAFDAMIATKMALAVCYPFAGNLGGGGFMVYRTAEGEKGSLDFREKAPASADRDMFLDEHGDVIPGLSYNGALAVGVPGTVAGIFAVHEKFGTMDMAEILEPVIKLAREGFYLTQDQANSWKNYRPSFTRENKRQIPLAARNLQAGSRFKNEALALTLERLVENGEEEFYGSGQTGKELLRFLKMHGGIISADDLASYEAIWRKPISFNYDDLTVISMAPPSSGGITLLQIMKMLEPYDLHKMNFNSVDYVSHLVEAERRAYADRNYHLGDPDFVSIPQELTDEAYLRSRMDNFDPHKPTPSALVAHGEVFMHAEHDETTHFSIVDADGNAVSVTTTLNGAFGSKLYVDNLGFFLNNQMDDFSVKAGVPNAYGLTGAEANEIAPGKRMLSSMTPTIVEKDGELWMVLGTPGGSTIITSVLQTILNVHEFKMTMQEAVNAPRFHHQWLPDEIRVEPNSLLERVKTDLIEKGYVLNESNSRIIGKVDAILIRPDGQLEGGADRRGDDTAVGY